MYADGSRHTGQWHKNKKHGPAVFMSDNGRTFEGLFDDDAMLGKVGQVKLCTAQWTQVIDKTCAPNKYPGGRNVVKKNHFGSFLLGGTSCNQHGKSDEKRRPTTWFVPSPKSSYLS